MRFKKSKLSVIPVCLFLFMSIMLVSPVFAASTWYVDDSGGADFTTISDAVASAVAGDTIVVKDGTYVENVIVDKALTVKSENGFAMTVVQAASASADVFKTIVAGVTIDGFTVNGATSTGKAGVHVSSPESISCTVKNNMCINNSYGILIDTLSSNSVVTNNTCTSGGRAGIHLTNTVGNIVTGNTCYNNTVSWGYGIALFDNADNNTVTDNTCYSNNIGIRAKNADSNIIFKNSLSSNNYGIEVATGAISNVFYLNNIISSVTANFHAGASAVAGNFWNSQEPIEYWFDGAFYKNYMGNYWSNYAGTDADGDGIGDTPYPTFDTDSDAYPLIQEYAPYFQLPIPSTSASLDATANLVMSMVGIELDRDSIDYGDVAPGASSAVETVMVTNVGTVDCDVSLEVTGADATAQDFYEQSLYVDGGLYDIDETVASIVVAGSEDVDTQLQVPLSWGETGAQEAVFVFWAEAS